MFSDLSLKRYTTERCGSRAILLEGVTVWFMCVSPPLSLQRKSTMDLCVCVDGGGVLVFPYTPVPRSAISR